MIRLCVGVPLPGLRCPPLLPASTQSTAHPAHGLLCRGPCKAPAHPPPPGVHLNTLMCVCPAAPTPTPLICLPASLGNRTPLRPPPLQGGGRGPARRRPRPGVQGGLPGVPGRPAGARGHPRPPLHGAPPGAPQGVLLVGGPAGGWGRQATGWLAGPGSHCSTQHVPYCVNSPASACNCMQLPEAHPALPCGGTHASRTDSRDTPHPHARSRARPGCCAALRLVRAAPLPRQARAGVLPDGAAQRGQASQPGPHG